MDADGAHNTHMLVCMHIRMCGSILPPSKSCSMFQSESTNILLRTHTHTYLHIHTHLHQATQTRAQSHPHTHTPTHTQVGATEARKSFFQRQLRQDVAAALSADLRQVLVLNLEPGSIVVDICLLPALPGPSASAVADERSPKILAYELAAQVSDPGSKLHKALTTRHAIKAVLKGALGNSQQEAYVKIATLCTPRGSLSAHMLPTRTRSPPRALGEARGDSPPFPTQTSDPKPHEWGSTVANSAGGVVPPLPDTCLYVYVYMYVCT